MQASPVTPEPLSAHTNSSGPNEQRTISREDVGFYDAVIIGATYELPAVDISSPESFLGPLKGCIRDHPFLCVVVAGAHTDRASYQRVPSIDLKDHVSIERVAADSELEAIERTLEVNVNRKFRVGIPPWRVVVLPLGGPRCFVAFAYSHTIGDGITGMAFHQAFLKGWSSPHDSSSIVQTPAKPLPAPFDTAERLPVSWSFLLSPMISLLLPRFLIEWLNLRHSASTIDSGTWTATNIFYDANTFHSRVKLGEISAPVLARALAASKRHNAKLTSTMLQLLARGLSNAVADPSVTNFVSQTAVNMRRSVGVPDSEMGEFASGCYLSHPRSHASGNLTETEWTAAREGTKALAMCAATLTDQAISLLRYLPSIRRWTLGKLGQRRDCSVEVSNVGAFEPEAEGEQGAKITGVLFTQPGHVISAPISLNFASVKGGSLMYTVTWQVGALALEDEEGVIDGICKSFEADLGALE